MGYQRPDLEDEWRAWEPEPPKQSRWLWVGIAMVFLFLIGICLVGTYLVVTRFENQAEIAPPPLLMPTSPFAPTLTAGVTETAEVEPTPLTLAATATLNQPGIITAPPVGAGNVEAVQLPALPAIDGNLVEWTGMTTYQSTFRVYSANGWDGSDDLMALWRLGWDNDSLYIAVEVTDDTHVQTQTGNQIFRGDSVDMQFDTDRAGDYGPRLSPDDWQITFSPGDFAGRPPSAFRFQGTSDGSILDAPGGHSITVAAQRTDKGYNLEAAIPWRDLNVTPSTGLVLGLALNVSDNDTSGTAVQEVMMSHMPARRLTDPTTWGALTLK